MRYRLVDFLGFTPLAHRPPLPKQWWLYCAVAYFAPSVVLTLVPSTDVPYRDLVWLLTLVPAYLLAYTYTGLLDFAGPVQASLRVWFGWRAGDYWFPEVRSLGGAGSMGLTVLGRYATGWFDYVRGDDRNTINVTLNMVVDNHLKFDTIVADRRIWYVWPNAYRVSLLRRAAMIAQSAISDTGVAM